VLSAQDQTVILKCRSSDPVFWTFNKGKLPHNIKTVTSDTDSDMYILMITSPTIHNSGTYTCYGKDAEYGYAFDDSSSVTIQGK